MTLQDALFNWLQIKIVSDARENDGAAKETLDFFEQILREDHLLTIFRVESADETMYHIRYETADGKAKKLMFDRETADKLLDDINSNPKYNE